MLITMDIYVRISELLVLLEVVLHQQAFMNSESLLNVLFIRGWVELFLQHGAVC